MVPHNTRTVIIRFGFPAGTSHAGVAGIISDSLAGLVDSIQVCPGGIVRISFIDPAHKKTYEEARFISFGDLRCDVVVSTQSLSSWFICFLLNEIMTGFWDIKEIRHQQC